MRHAAAVTLRRPAFLVFVASVAAPLTSLAAGTVAGSGQGFLNDFTTYWLAGKLVWSGRSPYDLTLLAQAGAADGLVFQPGTGYSYPLPFAVAMVPLGWLPFGLAGLVFSVLSLTAFGVAVTAWLGDPRLFRGSLPAALGLAVMAGAYPPVLGSAYFGQANLLVFALLVVGVRSLATSGRTVAGGAALGLAGIVKVVPLIMLVPLAMGRRWRSSLALVGAAVGALFAAGLIAPYAWNEATRLLQLGVADPYWTNQSLNGFASRLVIPTTQSLPAFPHASLPTIAWASLLLLAGATLGILLWRRGQLRRWDGLALGVALALVAATAAAPKDSFWDHVPALVGAGLLLAVPGWRHGRWRTAIAVLVAAWFVLAVGQVLVNAIDDAALRSVGPASAYLTSLALYGLIALWAATGLALAALPDADDGG